MDKYSIKFANSKGKIYYQGVYEGESIQEALKDLILDDFICSGLESGDSIIILPENAHLDNTKNIKAYLR